MSVKTSTNRFPLDALTVLHPTTYPVAATSIFPGTPSTPVTASGASANYIPLDVLTAYWNTGDDANLLETAVVLEVTALTGTGTYSVAVQVAPDAGVFASPVAIGTLAITQTGRAVITVNRDDIVAALGGSETAGALRLYFTLGGTSPSITVAAYVAPLTGE
jgi:hypothetical protein